MRIELSKDLDKENIEEKIKTAEIVTSGDYILIPKTNRFSVYDHQGITFIDLVNIEYIETVSNECSVYIGPLRYTSRIKLYEYLDEADYFIRISKSVVINKHHIKEIKPSLNMKFKVLVNETWLEVNRTYYYDFKDEIGI